MDLWRKERSIAWWRIDPYSQDYPDCSIVSAWAKLIVHFSLNRGQLSVSVSLVYNRVVNIQFILPTYLLQVYPVFFAFN